ncbi:MAG TPA: nucleoid occlusion protein [Erysipelotrichaceae bacterium]|nr:nucleoid occlusion protein [Erysipelotrichaceae bacterium]
MKQTRDIPLNQIVSNRYQPRLNFKEDAIRELALSIQENGLIQPISVRQSGDHYEIIAGERRYRAMSLLQAPTIPCFVLDVDDSQMAEMALVENIQREDLSAIEEAKAFVIMIDTHALTQDKIAAKIGKSQSSVANKIRLLQLPVEIQAAVSDKQITERHARALLGMDEKKQMDVYKKITEQNLNVKQTEALVEHHKEDKKVKKNQTRGITRNLRVALNTVHAAVNMIKKTGIVVEMSEKDQEEFVEITLRFPK